MSTPLTETQWRQVQDALKAQLISVLCTLPLSRLQSMLKQAEHISTVIGGILYDALFQARNVVHDHGPDSATADHYHMIFETEWESAEARYKATNQSSLKLICEHWYLTGRLHQASTGMHTTATHDMHPFEPGFDSICVVCDKDEKTGFHGSDNPLDYSADADPTAIVNQEPWEPTAEQLQRLRTASERTSE